MATPPSYFQHGPPRELSLVGAFFALTDEGVPVLAKLAGDDSEFVLVFRQSSRLAEVMYEMGVILYFVYQVADHRFFVHSLMEEGVRVALDPYIFEGRMRWTEVFLEDV